MPFLDNGTSSIEVPQGELLVGSGAQAKWRVLNSDLAARHFTIRTAPDGTATLKPYSPSTIVVINGTPTPQQGVAIRTGDVIAAGSARFAYVDDLEAPRPEMPAEQRSGYLLDEAENRAYALSKRTISIGRDAAAAIQMRDLSVSRFHADIRSEAGEFVLYSMGSAGTHVNEHRVAAAKMLEEGDLIRIGGTTFRFTRGELPAGVKQAKLGDHDDDTLARRSTTNLRTVRSTETTGTRAGVSSGRGGMLAVALGVAALAAAAYYMLGRN
jgi:pSer/pThr/pTyr-binding forkhead associated (FHA) protein